MAKQPDAQPGVSYVMPVLNEVEHIEAAIDSLIAQDYEGQFEVVLALGPSVDGTNDVIAAMQKSTRGSCASRTNWGRRPAG